MSLAVKKIIGYAAAGLGPYKGGLISQVTAGGVTTGSNNQVFGAANTWNILTNNTATGTQSTEWGILQENPTGAFFGPPRAASLLRNRGLAAATTRSGAPFPYYANNWGFSVIPGVYMLTIRWPSNITNAYNRFQYLKLIAWNPTIGAYVPVFKSGLTHAAAGRGYEGTGGIYTTALHLPRSLALTSGPASGFIELIPLIFQEATYYWDLTFNDLQYANATLNFSKTYMQFNFLQIRDL